MRLNNDFFEVTAIEAQANEIRCKTKLNPEHFIYQAHFPGNPVTPGVCLVQMAAEILGQHFQKSFILSLLKNIKFKKIVLPDDEPTFVFTKVVFDDEQLSTNVSVEDGDVQFVKMSLQFKVNN